MIDKGVLVQTIKIAPNRVLTYSEYGNKNAKPLFVCHGLNSSRLEAKIIHSLIDSSDFRIIGIDRPGMGGSSFQKKRTVLDFVDDIVYVADILNIDMFTVIGTSAGAAYALACTYRIPKRLVSCHIVSGLGAIEESFNYLSNENKNFIAMTKKYPWFIQPVFWLLMGRYSQNEKRSDKFLASVIASLDQVDKISLDEPTIRSLFIESFREAYINGSKGVAYDSILSYAKDWGFHLKEIQFNNIFIYNGGKDMSIPLQMGKNINALIRNSKYRVYENEGHLSIVINQIADIKEDITMCWNQSFK